MAKFKAPLTRLLKKAFHAEDTPDPWDEETDKAVRGRETTAVCARYLELGANETWLCRNCGFPWGDYINTMPYLYIFSIGAFFRSGVDGTARLTLSKVLAALGSSLPRNIGYSLRSIGFLFSLPGSSSKKISKLEVETQHLPCCDNRNYHCSAMRLSSFTEVS